MVRNLRLSKIFWSIAAACAFLAALAGVINRDVYSGVFLQDFLPGAFPQDVLNVLVTISLFALIVTTRESDVKKQIIIVGLIGSFFYYFGILTIERVYNWYYLLYAAAFASSFWSIVYSLSGLRLERLSRLRLGDAILRTTAFSSIAIAVLFTVLWTVSLIPLMREHNRIEYMYSIYILDLCFVMPAFVTLAVMSLRRQPFGILLTPAMMILGFFVIFPLGMNELAKPSAGMAMDYGSMMFSFLFSLYMLSLAVLQLRATRLE